MLPSILIAAAMGATPPVVSTHHLDGLRRELVAADGRPLAYWARAAAPATPSAGFGPYREVVLPGARLTMAIAARAAVVYAQAGDAAHAKDALDSVLALRRPDGSFAAELDARGKPGAASATAEAVWAIGQAGLALIARDPAYAAGLRRQLAKTVDRLLFATVPTYRHYRPVPGGQAPGWFLDGSPAGTAQAMVGLASIYEDAPSPALGLLLRRYGDALAEHRRGSPARFPFTAHMPDADGLSWQPDAAWGLEAMARAGKALHDRRWLADAREVAENLAVHQVLEGPPPGSAADVLPLVRGLTALSGVTGEARYARLAGLLAGPLVGRYDEGFGRFDDRPGDPTLAAGAPRTLDGLLALQAIAAQPRSWAYLGAVPVAPARLPTRLEAEALPGVARILDAGNDRRYVLLRPGELVRFETHVPAGPYLAIPIAARRPGGPATLRTSAEGVTQAWQPSLAWEAGQFPRPLPLKAADAVALRCDERARAAVQLDALVLQPALVARAFRLGDRMIWVVRNYGSTPCTWRQGKDAFGLRGYQAVVLERAAGM